MGMVCFADVTLDVPNARVERHAVRIHSGLHASSNVEYGMSWHRTSAPAGSFRVGGYEPAGQGHCVG
jgi:hypothetical protein